MKKATPYRFSFYLLIIIYFFSQNIILPQAKSGYTRDNNSDQPTIYPYDKESKSKKSQSSSPNENKNEIYSPKNKASNPYNKEKIENKGSVNYFKIEGGSSLWNGKHWNLENFPLKIYVKSSNSRYFKQKFMDYVEYAFKVWQLADNRIKYKFINTENNADIKITFVEDLTKKYEENYLGLTDYDYNGSNKIILANIQISLLKSDSNPVTDGEIKATIIHEVGHSLGLGHSDYEGDIMYPLIDPDHTPDMNYKELSKGDKEAIHSVIDLGINTPSQKH
jgi:predicted Zn-dependent protease